MKQTILIVLCLVLLTGCSVFGLTKSGPDPIPETAKEQLFRAVSGTDWLLTLTVVGCGAGFFAFLNGSSKGLQFMAACFVTLSLVLGLNRYSAWIAGISMIGAVCLVVYTVLVKNRALKEVVQGVQNVRETNFIHNEPGLPNRTINMAKTITEVLDNAQTDITRSIVKTVKGTL